MVPRAMGIVALAVVAWRARVGEVERHEAVANADGGLGRGTSMLQSDRNGAQKGAPMELWNEHRPRRSRTGGTGEQHSGVVLA